MPGLRKETGSVGLDLINMLSQILQFAASVNINFQGLLFAGIIIGALGAIMDMTMSIASAIIAAVPVTAFVAAMTVKEE